VCWVNAGWLGWLSDGGASNVSERDGVGHLESNAKLSDHTATVFTGAVH